MISSRELSRQTGLTYREVDHWIRRGVLAPTVEAGGSGTRREFDDLELRVALVLRSLRTMGARLDLLTEVGAQLREWSEGSWGGWLFVDTHGRIRSSPCSMCFVLDLEQLLSVAA